MGLFVIVSPVVEDEFDVQQVRHNQANRIACDIGYQVVNAHHLGCEHQNAKVTDEGDAACDEIAEKL